MICAMILHGHNRRNKRTRTYSIWTNMISRCYNKSKEAYKYYGARGVTVHPRWREQNGFNNFLMDMGECPSNEHSLDRKDPTGNYEPDNCRWATKEEQLKNRRIQPSIDNDPDPETLEILLAINVCDQGVPF